MLTRASFLLAVALSMTAFAQEPPAAAEPERPGVLWTVPLESTSFGGAAIADIDADGDMEVAFATYFGDSKVRVVNGKDGSEVWTFDASPDPGKGGACLDASLRVTDLDGDDRLELIVPVSNTSQVLCFDARTGGRRWTYEAGMGECIDTPPCIADIDGDGFPEVLVGTFKGKLHILDRNGKGVKVLKVAAGAVQSCPLVLDLDGDGVPDYIAANFRGDHAVHAVSGVSTENDVKELWTIQTGDHLYHGPSLGDLDGDGRADMAIGSYDGKVYAFRTDGSSLWTVNPGERYIMAPTVIADLDGDGSNEVIATSENVTVLEGGTGEVRWSAPVAAKKGHWPVTRGVSLADLDGDGTRDLVTLNGSGLFRVLRASDGKVMYELDCASLAGRPVGSCSHGPTIADLDGDGRLDVFLVIGGDYNNRHGVAIALTGFNGRGAGWPMFRGNIRNTGDAERREPR